MKEIKIEDLISRLQKLQASGNDTIQVDGTLMCESDGNNIIISTESQM